MSALECRCRKRSVKSRATLKWVPRRKWRVTKPEGAKVTQLSPRTCGQGTTAEHSGLHPTVLLVVAVAAGWLHGLADEVEAKRCRPLRPLTAAKHSGLHPTMALTTSLHTSSARSNTPVATAWHTTRTPLAPTFSPPLDFHPLERTFLHERGT
ncbi:hypothetical protein HPB52_018745 [Rhipicephalus sanguineus]|uniref:Uncharacterized protein n=1 Tax=Rhipicephalus sanguineus TaxID=34632 RepID=A0A9D4SUY6_RHISA|nr:hypothetical protein HPB52_018745 [Rhipicephalus sanguineus]